MNRIRNEIDTGVFKLTPSNVDVGLSAKKIGFSFGSFPTAFLIGIDQSGHSYQKSESISSLHAQSNGSHYSIALSKSSPKQVLEEINSKRLAGGLLSTALTFFTICLIVSLIVGLPIWVLFLELWAGAVAIYTVKRRDEISKITAIYYSFDEAKAAEYEQLFESIIAINQCSSFWNFETKGKVVDPKYNAGAQSQIDRYKASISKKTPPFIQTNVDIACLEFQGKEIYFFPDRIIFYKDSANAIEYSSLHFESKLTKFIETWTLPTDAKVISKSWMHMNKSGGPDRRFRDNWEIPTCQYEMLEVTNFRGFQANLLLSRSGFADPFITSLRKYCETDSQIALLNATLKVNDTEKETQSRSPKATSSNIADAVVNQKHDQPETQMNIIAQFFDKVGPPKDFKFSQVEKDLPVGLKLYGLNYLESAFVKVEKSPGDSYGRICIQRYSSPIQAKHDFFDVMMKNVNTFLSSANKRGLVGVEHFYSNQIDERYAFLGLSGEWIIHGVFPKRDSHENYVEELFSIDSTNEELIKHVSARLYSVQHTPSRANELDNTFIPIEDGIVKVVPSEQEFVSENDTNCDATRLLPTVNLGNINKNRSPIEETSELATYVTGDLQQGETVPANDLVIPTNPVSKQPPFSQSSQSKLQDIHWYSKNEVVVVHNYVIQDGMVFVGMNPIDYKGEIACLIDPSLPISGDGDYRSKLMGYWPRYSQISPEARAAYLNWLANGRSDPVADIGFVFLYFYGLEKRYFDFIPTMIPSEFNAHEIHDELKRLKTIYGSKNKSFDSYLSLFLEIVIATTAKEKLYELALPTPSKRLHTSLFYIKILFGQAMRDQYPLNFSFIKFWIECDLDFNQTYIPIKPDARYWFWKILESDFNEDYPFGMTIEDNNFALSIHYHPASPPCMSVANSHMKIEFENVPDMDMVSGLKSRIQDYINSAAKTVDSLKKVIRYAKNATTDELLLSLPAKYWREDVCRKLVSTANECTVSPLMLSGREFNELFDIHNGYSNQTFIHIVDQLEEKFALGIVPSASEFVVPPTSSDKLILYKIANDDVIHANTSSQYVTLHYTTEVAVELAAFITKSDLGFTNVELAHFDAVIDAWTQLAPNDKTRLKLKLKLLDLNPRSLNAIKLRLKKIIPEDRELTLKILRDLISTHAEYAHHANNLVKIISSLFDVTESLVRDVMGISEAKQAPRFTLDREKIAELQKESQQISVMLVSIFEQEQPIISNQVTLMEHDSDQVPSTPNGQNEVELLKGLDKLHNQFLFDLCSRREWPRSEAEAIARKLGLMTDGAIERINDAAFEQFDMPLIEGDDPIEMNLDLIEKLPNESTSN